MTNRTLPDGRRTRETDSRLNAEGRRKTRGWLVSEDSPWLGTGDTVRCAHCWGILTATTLELDRMEAGGSYARPNLAPAGRRCNLERSDNPWWFPPHLGYCAPCVVTP